MRRVTAIEAAQILRDGGIVVFPTETVYGLAANAMDHAAVNRLYELKGREAENKPFTCQVPDTESVFQFAVRSPIAVRLASFWPGPITLVLPALPEQNHLPLPAKPRSAARIPAWVTGGSSFCGFRIPDEEQALAMLRAAGVPVAAPSANFTGRKPPVSFDEIDPELLERVDGCVDGGACRVGRESSVVLVDTEVKVLREGAISKEEILERAYEP